MGGVSSAPISLWRRLLAELLGSAFLAALVIGSGIAAQRLSPGQTGLELMENAAATAAGLFAIILMFGPVSGGHFNPVVSFADAAFGGLSWRDAAAYLPAQVAGCTGGAVLANLMFALPPISISTKHRASGAHFLSEVIATLGLLLVIFALARSGRGRTAPAAVGAYIGAAYWFTSSTSFANPAITIGRMFSDTFAGIAPKPPPGSTRSPSSPLPMTTRPTTPAATASPYASPATAPPAGCSACSCSATRTPRSPSAPTSPPPPSTTA
jgi:arsenate reductase